MTENRNYLQKYAMSFGTYMGVYWICKFILFPLGFHASFLMLLFMVLTLGVPFMGYYYVKMYRDKVCNGNIGFAQACIFVIMMYVFAAMLSSVAHFVYFQFIDQGFIVEQYTQTVEQLMELNMQSGMDMSWFKEAVEQLKALTPTDITLQLLSSNIFYGAIAAIPTALLVMRSATPRT